MAKKLLLTIILSVLLLNCSSTATVKTNPKNKFSLLLKDYQAESSNLYPKIQNSLSSKYRHRAGNFFKNYKSRLTSIERDKLSENDQMSYDILLWECEMSVENLHFNEQLMPLDQFGSVPLEIAQLSGGGSKQPFKTIKDYDNWLLQLKQYAKWCDDAVVNMKIGIDKNYTIPTVLAEKVITQIAALDHGPVYDHLFFNPVKKIPAEFSSGERIRITKTYENCIEKIIIPAHQRLKAFLQSHYLPNCRSTSGINAIPGGKEYYTYLIKSYTTTTKSADEIFLMGQSEVDRITKEMETIKMQLGFNGELKAFFEYLRTKKELTPFTLPEEVIANFEAIHEKIKPNLKTLFDKIPKGNFEIKRVESFRESTASHQYYPGSEDGTRPGIFYVPIPDASQYNILSDEDTFLHEAVPGHHFQISLQQENDSISNFRKQLLYSAYSEGWALYAESLGQELGIYSDPYQYFGMLSAEMHRAIRLVVDTGIHSQRWTRERAIQYSLDHEAATEGKIAAEIERYMARPGQALSYKIGQLKIMELRNRAEKQLAEKFNIAQFHDQILNSGSIPLSILEDKIIRWIENQKKNNQPIHSL
ncbi:DUF885 family protein [Flavobacterium sp. CLA17]|uniref:DUF885 domain-containing protein n=1 Tax=Flavobacterium sp. CLA17 TaxID=2724135 RepID=UPI001490E87C|nr:DUF885 domain-containing protein [Flavobacterium sp. CLA17]QSB28779.1 DUF885 domain-containing protein [Flavobacterium sp. CLA17]